MQKVQLLICGTPASGKSSFGEWLAKEKGFLHVDMERRATDPASLDALGLRAAWTEFEGGGTAEAFIERLRDDPRSVVLTWGFPTGAVSYVERLSAAGLRVVWFEGDRLTSRTHFLARPGQKAEDFDVQFGAIAKDWQRIEPLCGQVVHTVRTKTPPPSIDTLFSEVFGRRY